MFKMICRATMVLSILANTLHAANYQTDSIPILPAEKWWGCVVNEGEKMPFANDFEGLDLRKSNWDNQVQPLMISSKGRYIWSNTPFKFQLRDGNIDIESNEVLGVQTAGKTLREAYLAAAKQYFPADGRMPDLGMFTHPQWNTWIELGYNQNQESILKYAHSILREGFPPGIIMLDDTWQEDYGTWSFHVGRFPNPKAMIEELHALGFKVMVWVIPCVSPDSYQYRQLVDKKALLLEKPHSHSDDYVFWADRKNQPAMIRWWNGVSAVLDLTNPVAMDWFKQTLDGLQRDFKVDGFKFDGGDWYFYPKYTTSPFHATIHAQKYCELGLNYPLNEYRSAWKMAGKPLAHRLQDKRHNWSELQDLIPHMLTQGLLGYTFGCPDMIGGGMLGSFGETNLDQDLFVRSAQIHALMPMMQFSMAPWRVLDDKHLQAVKSAVSLRQTRFETEIVRLAKIGAHTGEPIVRHMEYVFPNQGLSEIKDQFMLGDSILVAPITHKENRRSVSLPAGKWLSDEGKVFNGPMVLNIDVPIERFPYFIRQNATLSPINKSDKQKFKQKSKHKSSIQ